MQQKLHMPHNVKACTHGLLYDLYGMRQEGEVHTFVEYSFVEADFMTSYYYHLRLQSGLALSTRKKPKPET